MKGTEKSLYAHALERNVQTMALAQLNHQYIRMTGVPRSVLKSIPALTFTMELPTAVFNYESLSPDNETFLKTCGLGQDPNDKGAWIGSPLSHQVGQLFKLGPIQKGFRPGLVNHLGYLAYIQAIRGAQVLSYVGRASSFGEAANTLFFTDGIVDTHTAHVTVPTLDGPIDMEFGPAHINVPYQYSLSTSIAAMAAPLDNKRKLEGFFTDLQTLQLPGEKNMHFFPYFHGLLDADKDFTFEIFNKYLMNCVSDSVEGVSNQRKLLRAGFRNLAPTRSGKMLSHMYYGLDLSIEQSGKITLVVENGVYLGFVICFKDAISFKHLGVLHTSKDKKEIKEELGELGKHEKNLKSICAKLNAMLDVEGDPRYSFSITDIDTSYKLISVFRKIDFEMLDMETRVSIGNLLADLRFGHQEPIREEKTVIDFLRFMASKDISVLKDYRFVITPALMQNLNDLYIGLSIFGSRVPSLNYGGRDGLIFTIPNDGANDNNVIGSPRALQYIPFKYRSFSEAYVEWKAVLETGSMSFPRARKGKAEFVNSKQVDLRIANDPSFTDGYRMIKNIVNASRRAGREGRKRLGEGEDGARKRQKNVNISLGDDI
jgi:hypothetical protein